MRARSVHTTLTFNPLPPKEGEEVMEVMWSSSEHHSRKKDFRIGVRADPYGLDEDLLPLSIWGVIT